MRKVLTLLVYILSIAVAFQSGLLASMIGVEDWLAEAVRKRKLRTLASDRNHRAYYRNYYKS